MDTVTAPEIEVEPDARPIRALELAALRASFWSIIEYGSATALRVVSSLVLTRLLLPSFFGEMALLMTLIVGINLLSDIGLAPSVIQSPRGDDPAFLNTAWSLQVLRGSSLWVVATLIAWPMSLVYHDPQFKVLLPVLALSTLLGGFYSTNLLSLSRHMGVRRLFAIDVSSSLVSLIITIVWAKLHPSVWAIVGAQVIASVYKLTISHIQAIAPGIRNHFHWDKSCVTAIVHFGKWILLGTGFFFFASQADRLILGRLISLSMLGIYSLAYQLSDVPRSVILALSQRVAYPFISRIIDLPAEEFRTRFLQYRMWVLTLGGVLLAAMATWGNLLILKLYDNRYHAGAWMIPVLALGLWHTLLYSTTAPVLFSMGKPKYNALGNALFCTAMLIAIPIAFKHYGMFGAVIAVAAGDFPLYLVILYGSTREKIRPFRQDLIMTGGFLVLLATGQALKHLPHLL
jgi:O-antigen/teichoic acid export membrane protein